MVLGKYRCHMRLMTHTHTSSENAKTIILPLLLLVVLLAAVAGSILSFGIAGLMVPVLTLIPMIFAVLIWISLGKA